MKHFFLSRSDLLSTLSPFCLHISLYTNITRCRNVLPGLVAARLWAPGLESERNSYCVSDHPVVSQNTSLHFNRLCPFTSQWEVGESVVVVVVGRGSLFVVGFNYGAIPWSYQDAMASNNGKYTCLWAHCEPVHVTEPPLSIASHKNLQSVYSHRRGIMNSCSGCSIHLSCIH